jgi:chemotaxis protein histidine kinase CheA
MNALKHAKLQEFIQELSGFALKAETTLAEIERDMELNKNLFSVFAERMFAIRGSAQQLGLEHIATIAGLGEEIAIKGTTAETRPQIRKCIGCLWDALTTVKYLLEHYEEETGEEQEILMNRLQATLRALGGARPTVSESEIESLLNARK